MITFRELSQSMRDWGMPKNVPWLVQASLPAIGEVRGGADTLLGALLTQIEQLIMPAFTFRSCIIPEVGPANNGLIYGSAKESNRFADFFTPYLPVDEDLGIVCETLRQHPKAGRSQHPIWSFCGIGSQALLESQSVEAPLAPLQLLAENKGWVLLIGEGQNKNLLLHAAEKKANRKTFVRYALTHNGIMECPQMPGCNNGFEQAAALLQPVMHRARLGEAQVSWLPALDTLNLVSEEIYKNPQAFLCADEACLCCAALRVSPNA